MIHTYLELLEATLAKFKTAKELSKNYGYCAYGRGFNYIGCAIGCHLPKELAESLDEIEDVAIINVVLYSDKGDALKNYIDIDAIGIDNLTTLQRMHDGATGVPHFRRQLHDAIAAERKSAGEE